MRAGDKLIVLEEKKEKVIVRKPNTDDLREAVYALLMLIPIGKVTTYKALARAIGVHPRTIARFMASNRNPIVIPCHRVVMSNGNLGGYSLGGTNVKKKLLEIEGVKIINGKVSKDYIIDFTYIIGSL